MTVRGFTGRSHLLVSALGLVVLLLWVAPAVAADVMLPAAAESGYQDRFKDPASRDGRVLDPAVFTSITPYTVSDRAVRLPVDQREPDEMDSRAIELKETDAVSGTNSDPTEKSG